MSVKTQNKFILWVLFYALTSMAFYYLVFFFNQHITQITQNKDIRATLLVLLIVVCASGLYGNTASLFLKNTLERKLDDPRQERNDH
ncbi:MAG TPA: hypothetical protein DEF34_06200 [Desulfotomaculum sp.]|nr:hypothetical protein [Desulfotomaculum sp.]